MKDLFLYTVGSRKPKMLVVGDFWTVRDAELKIPFMSQSGLELAKLMKQAGVNRAEVLFANCINARPPSGEALSLFTTEPQDYIKYKTMNKNYWLLPQYLSHVEKLLALISHVKPNLIVPLGAIPLFLTSHELMITSLRGTVFWSSITNCKTLPTFHPSHLFKQYKNRPLVVFDFMKAKRESEFPELRRPERIITIDPSLSEIRQYIDERISRATHLAVDIETKEGQITCIGFADTINTSLVIPFWTTGNSSYWSSKSEELSAWAMVQEILSSPTRKIFQNGLYDLQYLLRMGMTLRNCTDDIMLLHHSLYPELQKSLGFMASVYTNEPAWKLMRRHRDDEKVGA